VDVRTSARPSTCLRQIRTFSLTTGRRRLEGRQARSRIVGAAPRFKHLAGRSPVQSDCLGFPFAVPVRDLSLQIRVAKRMSTAQPGMSSVAILIRGRAPVLVAPRRKPHDQVPQSGWSNGFMRRGRSTSPRFRASSASAHRQVRLPLRHLRRLPRGGDDYSAGSHRHVVTGWTTGSKRSGQSD
jgi:hypothetical protein